MFSLSTTLIFIALLILKATEKVDWGWDIVFLPFIVEMGVWVILLLLMK
jgi:hypothetical protein